jgi:hypothetical protein
LEISEGRRVQPKEKEYKGELENVHIPTLSDSRILRVTLVEFKAAPKRGVISESIW